MWRSSYNTKCTIFYHSSIYLAIQNIQNVQYSTISKYTKYTKYFTIVLYTLQYLHVPWFLQPYWTKSSLSALISGVQTCTILLHCKCWEPWQAKSSRSTFQWDWRPPRGVQIMLCLASPKSWWGGGYIQNIYRIYTKYIQNIYKMYLLVKFFLHCDFKHFAFDVWCLRRLPLGRITIQKGTTIKGLLEKGQKGISLHLNK